MNRVFANMQVRAVQEDERVIEGVASTNRRDRFSDLVEPRGIVSALPVPFLMDHNHAHAVGEVEHLEVTDSEIRFRARIPKIAEEGAAKKITDDAWSLIKGGLRKACSIGFRPLARERIDGGGERFSAWELLELSACAVPANPDARVTATRSTKGSVHVARLSPIAVRAASGAEPARLEDYRTYCRHHRSQFDQCLREGRIPPLLQSYPSWLLVEDMLDKSVAGRKAKREARR